MKNQENAIEVNNITKSFKVYYDKGNQLKEKLLFWKRNSFERRDILKGISFTVKRGEAIGLVGRNGCGKSTTLKMLTKIIYPDSGSIDVCGRVSSLLELGAGFHPDMSGRENIYINAAIFGLTRKEIDARLDDIIAFSELEDFIDNPVRTYSSGMYMRLAFSVAINVNADVLLIDEILGVGDANFQAKCFNKIKEIKKKGTTIVIVSHALDQIEQICERSIWIKDGKIEAEGLPSEVHYQYLTYMGEAMLDQQEKDRVRILSIEAEQRRTQAQIEKMTKAVEAGEVDANNLPCKLTGIKLLDKDGREQEVFKCGEKLTIQLDYKCYAESDDIVPTFIVYRIDGQMCIGTSTVIDEIGPISVKKDGKIQIEIENNLTKSSYWVDAKLEKSSGELLSYLKQAVRFEVVSDRADIGVARMPHVWRY